jgi:HEAT repeat protein
LERLLPSGYTPAEHAKALVKLADPVATACVAASQSSPERAQAVLESLLARGGKPAFANLTAKLDEVDATTRQAAEAAAERITRAAVPAFVALAQHPTPRVRVQSVRLLAFRSEPAARRAVVDSLRDQDTSVQRAALEAVTEAKTPGTVAAIRQLLHEPNPWPVRAHAARALGQITMDAKKSDVAAALEQSARHDEYALVRESAMKSLAKLDPGSARSVLLQARENDPEPRLRQLAGDLISKSKQ